ncbi:putative p53 and DNA damage-regulated protein 1 [Tanacetum coccineum]
MDNTMKLFQEKLIEIEAEGEYFLLAKHQQVENDRMRNGNREALTALRKRARTTKSSVPSPFELLMNEIDVSKPLVKEICTTCGNHDSKEKTWMMFPGTDIFARVPFHAAHTILEKGNVTSFLPSPIIMAFLLDVQEENQTRLDYDGNKLQSYIKEKSFVISELGALADKIGPGVLKSLVTLEDKPKPKPGKLTVQPFLKKKTTTAK